MLVYYKWIFILVLIKSKLIQGSNNRNINSLNNNNVTSMKGGDYPKFLQNYNKIIPNNNNLKENPDVNEKTEPTFFSLLFHPPVKKRSMDIGLEDSNQGILKAINMNEDEEHINRMLDQIEETEQNQVDSFYNSFDLQNSQLKEISKLF